MTDSIENSAKVFPRKKILTPEEIELLKKRHIRSFSGRKGHISHAQENALSEIFPKYELLYNPKIISSEEIFGRKAPLILEIGPGMGETSAAIAQSHPECDFIACEVFPAGIGAYSLRIESLGLANVRIIRHDAVDVVNDMIAEGSLAGIHIFFPDPWRKARHHKRRLIQPGFTHKLAVRLIPGGYMHLATDWADYADQMLEVLSGEPLLKNLYDGFSPVASNPLTERPQTKFQKRGEGLGHQIFDLVFTRTP